jgi:Zn-dependent protease with chaperone function
MSRAYRPLPESSPGFRRTTTAQSSGTGRHRARRHYVIEDPSPNAFATGVSLGTAAITFATGLLDIMEREELEGVVSHEMSHIKNHDIRLLLVVSTLIGIAALIASILWRSAFFAGGGRNDNGAASSRW